MIDTVSIIGMGALGILYGDILTKALGTEKVSFLADPARIEKYRSAGVYSNGEKCTFSFTDCTKPHTSPDLLIFAVKGTALSSAIETARPFVGKNTIILSVLNGISSEETLSDAFGQEHLIYCVAQGMDAMRSGNKLQYEHRGELCIGLPEQLKQNKPLLDAVTALFDRTNLPYRIEKDIMYRMWSKWMLNVGVNQVVMVTRGTYSTVQKNGDEREMMKSAMREVVLLSQKEGINLTEHDLDQYVALVDTLNPDGMPSMRQDGLAGRKTEVELFAGTVIRRAQAVGLSVPVNSRLYETVRHMETK